MSMPMNSNYAKSPTPVSADKARARTAVKTAAKKTSRKVAKSKAAKKKK